MPLPRIGGRPCGRRDAAMRLEFYHVGRCVFCAESDVLPGPGSSLVFPVATAVLDLRVGELATAEVDATQPPLEFDYSRPDGVVTRLAVRKLERLAPE